MTLVNEKDNHASALAGNHPELKPGKRLKLNGKSPKIRTASLHFE
jgi:hypothetical protein